MSKEEERLRRFYNESIRLSRERRKKVKGPVRRYQCSNCGFTSTDNLADCIRCGRPREN